ADRFHPARAEIDDLARFDAALGGFGLEDDLDQPDRLDDAVGLAERVDVALLEAEQREAARCGDGERAGEAAAFFVAGEDALLGETAADAELDAAVDSGDAGI